MEFDESTLADLIKILTSAPDVSHGPLLERLIWTFLAFSILIVGLRLYTKIITARKIFVDDVLMVLAVLVGIVHAALVQTAVHYGFGKHLVHVGLENLESVMKYGVISLLFGWLSPVLGRISFCYTLLYLTGTDSRIRSWPVMILIFLQVAVNCVGIIVFYTQCGKNMDTFWNAQKQLHYLEYCWDPKIQTYFGYFMGSFNTVTDAYLMVLPAVLIHHTSLSLKRKTGVALLLCLSFLAMVASAVKTYEAKALSEVTDYTYNLSMYVIALAVELNIVIISASLALLRPLFKRRLRNAQHLMPAQPKPWNSHIPLSSALTTKNHSRTNTAEVCSLDGIVSHDDHLASRFYECPGSPGVLVTTEVQISYESLDIPHVHAALVGLIQGERANPALTRT